MNNVIYLDNAATSFPKPDCVIKEVEQCIKNYCVNVGRSSHKKSTFATERVFKTRENLSELFNISTPERIAFTFNTTQSLNMGIKGILKSGDHLIISSMEHNSVFRPAHALLNNGISYSIAKADKNGEIKFKDILPHIKSNTKMVVLMHASNVTGRINNLSEIGKELKKRAIIFLVDAAQSAGIINIDVKESNIDILCFPGHKGLLAPTGTGGIYVSEKVSISPLLHGGTGSMSESRLQPEIFPDALESGTPNILGISALCESSRFVLNHIEEIHSYENYLANILSENLNNIPGIEVLGRNNGENTGIVCVKLLNRSPSEIAYLLDRDYSIATRAGFHCCPLAAKTLGADNGTLRFSVGFFNSVSDIEIASLSMQKIISSVI